MQVCFIYSNNYLNDYRDKQKKKYSDSLELFAKKISSNNRLKKCAIFVLGTCLYLSKTVYATTDTMTKVDAGGAKILAITRGIGYWACIIACAIEIIRTMLQGDSKSIGHIMAKYALSYGALYLMPWILDLIKSIFI